MTNSQTFSTNNWPAIALAGMFSAFTLISCINDSNNVAALEADNGNSPVSDKIEIENNAFPGCEGWGCDSEGGKKGSLYIVTSTADSGPGTLREALEATGKRYIITQVDGIIELKDFIRVTSGDVTLDLRRPPGGGLTLWRKAIIFQQTENVVVLGVRYRGTEGIPEHGVNAATIDCIGFTSVQQAVVAKSSFFGCSDEAVSIERAAANSQINAEITIQENLFLEGCMIDCQAGEGHARPINLSRGWDKVSVHHNAFFGNERRQPQVAGCVGHPDCEGTDWPLNPQAFVGYNLVSYWLEQATQVKNGAQVDIIGNVYVPGPQAQGTSIEALDDSDLGTTVFLKNNTECTSVTGSCQEASTVLQFAGISDASITNIEISETSSGELLSENWLRSLGPDVWDPEDERVLSQFFDGTVKVGGGYDPNIYCPSTPNTGTIVDTDKDGIPDEKDPKPDEFSTWEDTNNDGWTDLEAYMNQITLNE